MNVKKMRFLAAAMAGGVFCAAAAERLEVAGFGEPAFADGEAETVKSLPPLSGRNWRMTLSPGMMTGSNRVDAAFGTDADGDGDMSPAETLAVVGFDRGEWFVLGGPGLESRWSAPALSGALTLDARFSASGEVSCFSFRDGGGPVSFAGFPPEAAFLDPAAWGAARLVSRGGGGAFAAVSFGDGAAVILR